MPQESPADRLSRISTLWTLVFQAHGTPSEGVSSALRALMERYGGAVHRYLLGALRSPDAADELFQEFSLRVLRGDFRNADPRRGRFRDFVKTAVFHLLIDYQRSQKRAPLPLATEQAAAIAAPDTVAEQEFIASWREELLERTWVALEAAEHASGQPHHTVLRLRADHPVQSSEQLGEQLGHVLGSGAAGLASGASEVYRPAAKRGGAIVGGSQSGAAR